MPEVFRRLAKRGRKPQRVILTKPLERDERDYVLELADSHGATVARLPRLTDFSGSLEERLQIRPIAIEDLLGRPQTPLDRAAMQGLVERSEERTSELQSLMPTSYAVFCLKKKKHRHTRTITQCTAS